MIRALLMLAILISCKPLERGEGKYFASLKDGTLDEENRFNAVFYMDAEVSRTETHIRTTRCVATALSPQLILTAAHCLYYEKELVSPEILRLRLSGVTEISHYSIPEKFNPAIPWTQYDYAFIVLKSEIKNDQIDFLPMIAEDELDKIDPESGIHLFGYEFAKPSERFYRYDTLPDLESKLISIPRYMEKGDSGGPLLVRLKDGSQRVAGVASHLNYTTNKSVYVAVDEVHGRLLKMRENASLLRTWSFDQNETQTLGGEFQFYADDWHLQIRRRDFDRRFFQIFAAIAGKNERGYVYIDNLEKLDLENYPITIPVKVHFKESDLFGGDEIEGVLTKEEGNRYHLKFGDIELQW